MTPPIKRPGFARKGQYQCRRHSYDPETRQVSNICGKPVPAGELTYLALNTKAGEFLALCAEHRSELGVAVEEWAAASVGAARLLADLLTLSSGELISETVVKEVLAQTTGRSRSKNGSLTPSERARGLELLNRMDREDIERLSGR